MSVFHRVEFCVTARSWFVLYPLDTHAMSYTLTRHVDAEHIARRARIQFGERPLEVWPGHDADVQTVDAYVAVMESPRPSRHRPHDAAGRLSAEEAAELRRLDAQLTDEDLDDMPFAGIKPDGREALKAI